MNIESTITVYIKLLEEGTPTMRPTQAVAQEDGLYKILANSHYDPEDEIWELLPGTIVTLKQRVDQSGEKVLVAMPLPVSRQCILKNYPDTDIIEVHINSDNGMRSTEAVDLKNGFYKLLPTNDYNLTNETWEFSPGSVIRICKQILDGRPIQLAFDQIREDRMDAEYACYVRNIQITASQ